MLVFAWAAWALLRFSAPPPEIATGLHFGHVAGQMLALFEVLLPFSIFVSFLMGGGFGIGAARRGPYWPPRR